MAANGRKISAKEIVQDIKSGMDDPALMEKYSLTEVQLDRVKEKLIAGAELPDSCVRFPPPGGGSHGVKASA